MTKLQLWLMTSQAMIGNEMQKTPKITEALIIERDLFFSPKNSPRYAKITLVAPEMNIPLRRRKHASWKRFTARLDKTEAAKAESEVMIKIFLLPYISLIDPQKCAVRMMPT